MVGGVLGAQGAPCAPQVDLGGGAEGAGQTGRAECEAARGAITTVVGGEAAFRGRTSTCVIPKQYEPQAF